MGVFLDKTGRKWVVELTIGAIDRVKSETNGRINLLHPEGMVDNKQTQVLLMSDLLEFWQVLYLLVEPQCLAAGITAEQFGDLMAADCLHQSQEVFWKEWSDFFLKLQRPELAMALEKIQTWTTMATARITKAMQRLSSQDLDSQVMTKLDVALNAAFGNSLDSSESIREDLPGDSSPIWGTGDPAMID